METFIAILAIVLGVVGIIGSIIPGIPGPPISWIGLLVLFIWGGGTFGGEVMSLKFLLIWLVITIIISILDYVVPGYFTRVTGGSKYAGIGAIVGLFIGLFISPLGMILGALIGAFLAEILFAEKDAGQSLKSALGAFLGFLFGTGIKLITSAVMMFYIIAYAF